MTVPQEQDEDRGGRRGTQRTDTAKEDRKSALFGWQAGFFGEVGKNSARKGHTLSTVDLLIAQTAIENSLSLMTHDEHFNAIAKHSPLTLFK